MIGIICAEKLEVEAVVKKATIHETKMVFNHPYYIGTLEGHEVVIILAGIGKVNAALSVGYILSNYPIDFIINTGSAGGFKDSQNVGDIIISKCVAHHDFDVTPFGRQKGEIPDLPLYFNADDKLIKRAQDVLTKMNKPQNIGLIVSGDQFIHQEIQVKTILNDFPEALCGEMESAAIGQACYQYQVPFLIIRSLSDVYGHGDSHIQFEEYLKQASEVSATLCSEMLKGFHYE